MNFRIWIFEAEARSIADPNPELQNQRVSPQNKLVAGKETRETLGGKLFNRVKKDLSSHHPLFSTAMAGRNEAAADGFSDLNPLHSEVYGGPLSFPSQPPDIRNWFSSYEYESPDCPELAGDGESETQEPLEVLGVLKSKHPPSSKDEVVLQPCQFVPSNEKISFFNGIEEESNDDKENYIDHINSNRVYGQSLQGLRGNLKRKQSFEDESDQEEDDIDLNSSASNRVGIGNEAESQIEDGILQNDQSFLKNTICEVPRDQNVSPDGFISTKKRERSKEEAGSFRPTLVLQNHRNKAMQENSGHFAGKEQTQAGKISALADRTNIQAAPEIPGKWQCPRKSKPYVGPPMKQLRLERWVRRVN